VERRIALPVLQEPPIAPKIRKSRTSRWRAAVLIAFHVAIAIHIAHWLVSGRTLTPVEPSEAMAFSKAGIVNAGLIFFAGAILLTALFGRWFCGWACHLVALQDLCRWLLEKIGLRPRPLRSRLLRLVPFVAFFYMFLWPAVYRLWLGDSLGVRGSELTTGAFWETFPGWVVGILTLLICGFATVYFLGAKGFCTYACPYGAAFYVADKVAPLRVRVNEDCEGSGHCTAVCTSNVRVHEEVAKYGMVVDSGCMKCGDCVSVCPTDALSFGFGRLPLFAGERPAAEPFDHLAPATPGPDPGKRSYPLTWREELVLGLAFLLAFATFRGLYGNVPFLMSLGLAGVLAFLTLLAVRLATRRDLAFRHRTLKRGGRLRPAGSAFVFGLGVLTLLWLHSAALQVEVAAGRRALRGTTKARELALQLAGEPAPPTAAEATAARAASRHFSRVARWALFPWLGLDSGLAWSSWLAGDLAGFRAASRRAIARHDSAYEMLLLSGRDAAGRGDLAGLTLAGERAIALDPRRFEAYAGVGMLLAKSGSPAGVAAAGSFFERGTLHFPASPVLAYNWGIILAIQGRPDLAIERFRQVLIVEPGHRQARENLAGMLAESGRMDEAAAIYRQAIDSAPRDADLHVLLAQTLMAMGKDEEARAELEVALGIHPEHPQARSLVATLPNRN
jgi:tetratricopeptide (TPR) repeat protein